MATKAQKTEEKVATMEERVSKIEGMLSHIAPVVRILERLFRVDINRDGNVGNTRIGWLVMLMTVALLYGLGSLFVMSDPPSASIGAIRDDIYFTSNGLFTKNLTLTGVLTNTGSQVISGALTVTGGLNVDEDVDIDLDAADEEVAIDQATNAYASGGAAIKVYFAENANGDNQQYGLRIAYKNDGGANNEYIVCQDNSSGAAANGDAKFTVAEDGNTTIAGTLTVAGDVSVSGTSDLGVGGKVTATQGYIDTSLTASKPVFTDGSKQLVSTGTLGVDQGGSGAATLLDHGVLVGSGTAAITPLAVGTDGQLLVGQSSADPAFTTVGGDATMAANGTLTLVDNAVPASEVGPGTLAADVVLSNEAATVTASNAVFTAGGGLEIGDGGYITAPTSSLEASNTTINGTCDLIGTVDFQGAVSVDGVAGQTVTITMQSTLMTQILYFCEGILTNSAAEGP